MKSLSVNFVTKWEKLINTDFVHFFEDRAKMRIPSEIYALLTVHCILGWIMNETAEGRHLANSSAPTTNFRHFYKFVEYLYTNKRKKNTRDRTNFNLVNKLKLTESISDEH